MNSNIKRVLIKVSGEALGSEESRIDDKKIEKICKDVHKLVEQNIGLAIVVGGGNFYRGRDSKTLSKANSDYMGMLSTILNGIALKEKLTKFGIKARIQSSIAIDKVVEPYDRDLTIELFSKNVVTIFVAGTGSPFFTTDTATILKALEIEADVVLMAKNIDGIYEDDPKICKDAKIIKKISYDDMLNRNIKVIDQSAIILAKEYALPIKIYKLNEVTFLEALENDEVGSIIQ